MIRKKDLYKEIPELTISKKIRIRFNETDPLGIVWHGYYITYFEDGREAFGREYNISYLDIEKEGYTTPIVKSICEHKLSLRYGDIARIETTFVDSLTAKIVFRYKIFNEENKIVCTGETVQVFLDSEGVLSLHIPSFFEKWKKELKLL